jgi:hypothetical protein
VRLWSLRREVAGRMICGILIAGAPGYESGCRGEEVVEWIEREENEENFESRMDGRLEAASRSKFGWEEDEMLFGLASEMIIFPASHVDFLFSLSVFFCSLTFSFSLFGFEAAML